MQKSAFIAIVGRPNAGKSSLLNKIMGEKIAIVSAKPQTTRNRITGVLTDGDTQLVFIDTPGHHKARTKLGTEMVKAVSQSIFDVDCAVLVVDAKQRLDEQLLSLIENVRKADIPLYLAINKIDLFRNKEEILEVIQNFKDLYPFARVVPISALTGDGVDVLTDILKESADESPHFFPEDTLTDQPEKVIVAEMVREKILNLMEKEVPHGVAVVVESQKERANGILDIDVLILCEKKNHKGMIIGKNGLMLKKIASEARVEAESFFETKINMKCWVKVKEDWRNKEGLISQFGLSNN